PPNLPKTRQAIERIIADANRACDIVDRIRSLSKGADPKGEWLSASAIVNEVVSLSRSELDRTRFTLRTLIADVLPLVFADGAQIQQVLLNIILNAAEAMSEEPAGEREIDIELSPEDGRFVHFLIRDRGRGIPPDAFEQVFDAFYSTKEDGVGIGL